MFGFGKKSLVGVDIGTASIKVVELSRSSGHFTLETYGIAQLAYGDDDTVAVGDTAPLETTVSTLRELMKRAGVKGRQIVASLPTSNVFITVISVPRVDPRDLHQAVEMEARKVVPLPLEDVTVSWNVIPDEEEKSDRQSVLLTAVPNHVVANYIQVFQELKLEPLAIEVEATALSRCLIGQDATTVLIVDMGGKTSTVNLIDRGFIYFSKHVNIGGEAITQNISQTLNINLERAEQFKKSMGFSGMSQGDNIPRSIQPTLNILKSEIQQVINLSLNRGRSVEKVILTGGSAKLLGLDKYIAASFNIPVQLGNPWARVVVNEKIKDLVDDLGPGLAVGTGLAMRHED